MDTRLVPATSVVLPAFEARVNSPVGASLVALAARETQAHPLVIRSLAAHAARGERLGVLIGHNRLDVYGIARLAQSHGLDPRPLLARIELSRAFTCHQLHRRILTLDIKAKGWDALYVLGLLDTFYDEDVKPHEAARLLRESLARLKGLAVGGLPVLITVSAPKVAGREQFLQLVAGQVDVWWEPPPEARALPVPPQLALPPGREEAESIIFFGRKG